VESVRNIGVSAMFPLTSISHMLLTWQQGSLEVAALSDSDCDEGGSSDGNEPTVKYATEEQYQSYVPHPASP
jgi:hypothetical protein